MTIKNKTGTDLISARIFELKTSSIIYHFSNIFKNFQSPFAAYRKMGKYT